MPKASEIAIELRKLADLFGSHPDVDLIQPSLSFYHHATGTKEEFIALAAIFPRPYAKGDGYSHEEITLKYQADAVRVYAQIERARVCTFVTPATPAVYECEPLLSQAEEEAVSA